MSNFNNLVIHVIRAKELLLKSKTQEVYVSLNTVGKSKWKSKVSTNAIRSSDGNCEWGEHCEFQLTEMDTEMHIHVNYKNIIGKTENLGQVVFQVSEMSRYQPPYWYRLTKKSNDVKERGYIQLEFQFANKIPNSVSSFSVNKIEKEKKFEKLKRKINLIGKSKKAILDNQSMISVSLSRKSSFSSNASALAFSSPSPNLMQVGSNGSVILSNPENFIQSVPSVFSLENRQNTEATKTNNNEFQNVDLNNDFLSANQKINNKRNSKDLSEQLDFDTGSTSNSINSESFNTKNIKTKMRHRAEQFLNLRSKKNNLDQNEEPIGDYISSYNTRSKIIPAVEIKESRPCSISSSSGFVSLGSNNNETLNENNSLEHLHAVIKHLRREILTKDNHIRDLEDYTDKLLSKIIIHHPEMLQIKVKSSFYS